MQPYIKHTSHMTLCPTDCTGRKAIRFSVPRTSYSARSGPVLAQPVPGSRPSRSPSSCDSRVLKRRAGETPARRLVSPEGNSNVPSISYNTTRIRTGTGVDASSSTQGRGVSRVSSEDEGDPAHWPCFRAAENQSRLPTLSRRACRVCRAKMSALSGT